MADIKQIMTQGANIERVDNPFIVSTGYALTKSELRARGVDVDNIAKYADLAETAHVFCVFSGDQQLNTCKLSLRTFLYDESADDNDITNTYNVDITKVLVGEVINEIQSSLANDALVDFIVELRNNRIQITARRAQAHIRVGELHILDSRGNANAESVNDLSNPERLFTYFWPDARGISRLGDITPAPARQELVTSQSIGVSQGEPRTSASLNRGIVRHSSIIDRTSLLVEVNASKHRKVRIPLEITDDPVDFTVNYSSSITPKPRAIWSSTSIPDPAGQPPVFVTEPSPRKGGSSSDLPHTVSVLALRGISISPKSLPFNTARIVNEDGIPLGLISPDSRIRGSASDQTDLDYGIPFINESSRWRVVKSDVVIGDHPLVIEPGPLSVYLAFPEDAPLIDENQFELLDQEVEFSTGFTRIDDVTLELSSPVLHRFKWARVRISGSEKSFIVREWINERRVIISEIPKELEGSSYYVQSARLSELDDPAVNSLLISRGIIANPEEWFYLSVLGTSGPLTWAANEGLYLEIDVADPPATVNNGSVVIMDVKPSTDLNVRNAVVRSFSPTARDLDSVGAYTLKGAHESVLGGMSLRHSVGAPYDTETFNELLTRSHSRLVNGPHTRIISDAIGGITLQQFSDSNPTLVFEQAGQNITVDLSEARSFYLGDEYADGIDYFLYSKFRVKQGDVRYRILRALTLRYASGTLSRDVTIHPDSLTLTLQDVTIATDLMENVGFLDEHIGLCLLVTGHSSTSTPLLIMITSVETELSARYKYLDTSNVVAGMLSEVIQLKLAPYHFINDGLTRGESPSIIIQGLSTVGERVDGPAAIEIDGERPLESYSSLGDWLSLLVPGNRKTFTIHEHDGIKYAQVPLIQDNNPLSIEDLTPRLKIREDMRLTSLGGRHWSSTGLLNPGNFPDFVLVDNPSTALSHVVEFYYKVSSQGTSSGIVYPPFKVESLDVIVVREVIGLESYIYGLLIPVPDHALTQAQLNGVDREVLIADSIEVLKKKVNINKNSAYLDNAYLDKPSALNEINVYASTKAISPRLEISVIQDYDEETVRPSGLTESRSEHISDFGGMRTSARVEARHEYQDRNSQDNNAVVVAEMSLSGGPGDIGLTANHRYDQESGEYLTLVTAYGSSESASMTNDGIYITDQEARCEDITNTVNQGGELTGFDHKHLSGDVAINTESVKKLSEELDAMKQREFAVLRQLSLLSASAHETLDMLRTANSTIRSLRNVQYELAMALFALMDIQTAEIHGDAGNNSIRDILKQRALTPGGLQLNQSVPHRLMQVLHLTGHLVMTNLGYDSGGVLADDNLGDLFEGTTHQSTGSIDFYDDIPLDYKRPGYARMRSVENVATEVDQNGPLDPTSDILTPAVYTSSPFRYLYIKPTYTDRDDRSKENFSWTAALSEMETLVEEGADKALSDFGNLVSRVSPLFSFKARADIVNNPEDVFSLDDLGNVIEEDTVVCMYLMGVGYWSPTSVGHSTLSMRRSNKVDFYKSGWHFTTTTTRRVGPEQVATSSNVLEYVENYTADNDNYELSRSTDALGFNSAVYDDDYILDQVSRGRDLIVGVTEPVIGLLWAITRASLLGYPDLFRPYSTIYANDTAIYDSFEEAKWGTELFYCVNIDEESPLQTMPSMWEAYQDQNSDLVNVWMQGGYSNSDLPRSLPSVSAPRLTSHKVVYCRAWCVARAESVEALQTKLESLGYPDGDIRINSPINVGANEWAAIRTRVGMSDFLKQIKGTYAAPGQVIFSFNKGVSGKYLNSDRQVKTSQDPV